MRVLSGLLAALVLSALLLLQGAPEAHSVVAVPIRDFVGVNGVVNNNPDELAQTAGWVRDYHKWYWYETTSGVYTWSSGWQRLDRFYGALKAAGVKVMPDVEFAPGWASSNGETDGIPNAAAHANYLAQLVRHYGDTIAAVENFNEPNQTWQPVRFPANVFGTMTRQDHTAVKAANPGLLFVQAGMAGPDTTYLEAANQASGGALDVVNFHWYAEGDTGAGGLNPEAGGLIGAIDRIKTWRDARAPGKPIWMTEFGWDTFKQPDGRKSKIYAPEANAANYLLRALFMMQGRGVEKGFVFMYRDPSGNTPYLHNVFLSSGLVTDEIEKDGRKKPGWYYLATLRNVLGTYAFERMVADGPNVYHYEYSVPGTNQRAAVLWARNGARDNGYRASYHGPAGKLVVPVAGSTTGAISSTNGDLVLTERPVFVLYTAGTAPSVPTSTPTPAPSASPTAAPAPPPATPTPGPAPTGAPAKGSERLTNGGFESGLGSWFVPSWFRGVVSADRALVHGGSQALRFKGNTGGSYAYQEVMAAPGETLEFSGWINLPPGDGSASAIVELVARHANNGDLKTFSLVSVAGPTGGWVPLRASVVAPDRTAKVRLQVRFPRLNGAAYLDDLSLRSR